MALAMTWSRWMLALLSAPVTLAAQDIHPDGHSLEDSSEALAFAGGSVGTSRQPVSIAHEGVHRLVGEWSIVLHGDATMNRRWEPAPRGENDLFFTNMLMASARRRVGLGWLELTARAS